MRMVDISIVPRVIIHFLKDSFGYNQTDRYKSQLRSCTCRSGFEYTFNPPISSYNEFLCVLGGFFVFFSLLRLISILHWPVTQVNYTIHDAHFTVVQSPETKDALLTTGTTEYTRRLCLHYAWNNS